MCERKVVWTIWSADATRYLTIISPAWSPLPFEAWTAFKLNNMSDMEDRDVS